MPHKLTKPLNVYSNFIEQTSNRNHAFVVMPQHINNSLEFEALKTNISHKKAHKSKKKKEPGKIPIESRSRVEKILMILPVLKSSAR